MKKHLGMAALLALIAFVLPTGNVVALQIKEEREFSGAINRSIRIKMTLSQKGNSLSGSYYYEKVGKPITLSGSINGQQFTLKEYNESGNNTGTFSGRFVTPDTIEGSWSNADASKTYPFSLKAGGVTTRPQTSTPGSVDGKYERLDAKGRIEKDSGAELNVETQPDGMIRVEGDATLVINAKTGNVRTGEISASAKLNGNHLNLEGDGGCQIKIVFGKGSLEVTEDNGQCGGLGVSFIGSYKRTGAPKFQ
jgi:hypothetical protein